MDESNLTERFSSKSNNSEHSKGYDADDIIGFCTFTFPTLILPIIALIAYPLKHTEWQNPDKVIKEQNSTNKTQDTSYLPPKDCYKSVEP